MPTWKTELPTGKGHMGFSIKRTPAQGALQAICTCVDLVVCDTHFWGGRTFPCERRQLNEDGSETAGSCAACGKAVPYRTHVYVSCFDAKTRDHFIFECTAAAAQPLEDYRTATGTLIGCVIHATRPKGGKNSKVFIQTNTVNLSRVQLPAAPDIIKNLCTIWAIPMKGEREHENKKTQVRVSPDSEGVHSIRSDISSKMDPLPLADVLAAMSTTASN
ncbi:MAG: hypothetical protein ACOYB0_10605 [Polynucleobacter sp.]